MFKRVLRKTQVFELGDHAACIMLTMTKIFYFRCLLHCS